MHVYIGLKMKTQTQMGKHEFIFSPSSFFTWRALDAPCLPLEMSKKEAGGN